MCVKSASAPCALESKFGLYLEKDRLSPFHSTEASFLVEVAPSSSSKRIREKPLVRNVVETKVAGKWSFKLSCSALKDALPPSVRPITVATLTWPSVGVKPNTWKSWGFGVLRDSRMFRARQQDPKHLALGCSWCYWKGLEA